MHSFWGIRNGNTEFLIEQLDPARDWGDGSTGKKVAIFILPPSFEPCILAGVGHSNFISDFCKPRPITLLIRFFYSLDFTEVPFVIRLEAQ